MSRRRILAIIILAAGLMLTLAAGSISAQEVQPPKALDPQGSIGTTFTYQGRLTREGSPVNGLYDLRFSLWDALDVGTGNQIGSTVSVGSLWISDGLITVELDFGGGAFNGEARYLQVDVRPSGGFPPPSYQTLTPRQRVYPSPYALALPGLWTIQTGTSPDIIGGHQDNSVTSGVWGATISGGGSSGHLNRVTDNYGTVGGGRDNQAGNDLGAIDDVLYATVGGGHENTASGYAATIGGGDSNEVSGDYATVPGGSNNTASGDYSFAAGRNAVASARGCFVWGGDHTSSSYAICDTVNGWVARTTGGATFFSNVSPNFAGVELAPGATAWSAITGRHLKANLEPVDGKAVLDRLATVPITTWNLKSQDPSIRHMGPSSEDFYTAFGLGKDDQHLSTQDLDGVALAAIQGLYELSQEQAGRIEQLTQENAGLVQRLAEMQARLAALEAAVAASQGGQP